MFRSSSWWAGGNRKRRPVVERLLLAEDNRRLAGFLGFFLLPGAVCLHYAYTADIDAGRRVLVGHLSDICCVDVVRPVPGRPRLDNRPRIALQGEARPFNLGGYRITAIPRSRRPSRAMGKLQVRLLASPPSEPSRAMKKIDSRSRRGDYLAYDLLSLAKDFDKVEGVGLLTRTEPTRLSGRMGIRSAAVNPDYYAMGTGDGWGDGVALPEDILDEIALHLNYAPPVFRPLVSCSTASIMASMRSTPSILVTVRSRSPALRRVYSKFLMLCPGLSGKVTLRFAIAPSGEVLDVALISSTTHLPEFDREVVRQVLGWRFEPIRAAGKDIVTVPLDFAE